MLINIRSVNIGKRCAIATKNGSTGIFKTSQTGSCLIDDNGMVGDVIVDREHHGGVDQAVYVYCQGDYDWWLEHHGIVTHAGLFGENLTVSGMTTADAHIGARLVGANVTLEITSPRTPCETLASRMKDPRFPKRFWQSHRTGFYCRVITAGRLAANETMMFQTYANNHVSISDWITHDPLENADVATRQRFLTVPIHFKARNALQRITPSV
jgi:MOSC domain-containing protein YiiM